MKNVNILTAFCVAFYLVLPSECYASTDVELTRVSADITDSSGFRVIARLINGESLKLHCLKFGYEGELYEVSPEFFENYTDIDLSRLRVTHGSVIEESDGAVDNEDLNVTLLKFVEFGLFSYKGEEGNKNKMFSLYFTFSDGKVVRTSVAVEESGNVKYLEFTKHKSD